MSSALGHTSGCGDKRMDVKGDEESVEERMIRYFTENGKDQDFDVVCNTNPSPTTKSMHKLRTKQA